MTFCRRFIIAISLVLGRRRDDVVTENLVGSKSTVK